MAGTGWNFVVEFDGVPEHLLSAVQMVAWESRRFQMPYGEPEFLDEIDFFRVNDSERQQMAERYGLQPLLKVAEEIGFSDFANWCRRCYAKGEVETLDELRALQCLSSDQTHSPLDLYRVADTPTDNCLFPLTDEQIVQVFGNGQPRLEQLESDPKMIVSLALPNAYARWQAVYCTVFTDAGPTHAYIEGASGD